MYKSLGIIPPGLSIKNDINTGHMKNSDAKWNELLKRQSFEMLDFLLHEYDEKFIKILDSICELTDRIYGECEDLDEANSIFKKLSIAKEKYIQNVLNQGKRKKLENHRKKFYERNQCVKNNKENIKDRKTKDSNNRHLRNDKGKKRIKKKMSN